MLHPASPTGTNTTDRPESFWLAHSPALIAVGLYLLCTSKILASSWFFYCDRHFVYSLDDTYISMAMAKNLALHGVWGVTPYAFSSSNSSPIFPLLLGAMYRLFGVNQFAPLALSWIFGFLSIFVAERLIAPVIARRTRIFTLILFVLFSLLFVAGVLGMEHSLHLLMTLLFLGQLADFTAGIAPPSWKRLGVLALVAALMVSVRYEGLFFVLPGGCVLLAMRRWKPLLAMSFGAVVPVCAYAVFSVTHGGYWLPNSVALKGAQGDHPSLLRMFGNIAARIADNYHEGSQLFWLLALAAAVTISLLFTARRQATLPFLLAAAIALQLALASNGFHYRYDIYLFGAAVVILARTLPAAANVNSKLAFFSICFIAIPTGGLLALTSLVQLRMVPRTARNIYLRQLQMARFVERYYPTGVVAANDIGAVDYYANIHCYDLVGLANQEIFNARRSGVYTTEFLRKDADRRHVQIAIAYDDWFANPIPVSVGGPALPQNWIRVARWYIPDPTMLRDRHVSFYAVDPGQAATLRFDLQQFAPELPHAVQTIPN